MAISDGTPEARGAGNPGSPDGLALRIHRQARSTPRAVALTDGDVRLDYAALDSSAAAVAQALRRSGVAPGQAVAVALPRSWRLVCVMLGILRLGALVVPLDLQSPAERRRHILEDCAAVALVHDADGAAAELPRGVRALAVDGLLPRVPEAGAATQPPRAASEVSFVFYTSGTSGRPKGVEVRDAGVLRLAQPGWIRVEPGMRYACLSNPAFDALSFEVWVPLLTGGCCVILRDVDVQTPELLTAALRRERIDTLFVTVALFNAVTTAVPDCFATVGQVLAGGEQLNAPVIRRWYRHNTRSRTRLFNAYGPTETTTFAFCHPIPRDFDGDVVPIGRPLPRTGAVLAVPGRERVAAPGEVAELLLSGDGLAAGYRNLPEETEQRFVRLPWLDGGRETYYRTGDLVRSDSTGQVEYVGRTDRQVKVRGFRIEPGEVERHVLAHPAVLQSYVCTRRVGEEGPNELLAFVVRRQDLDYEEFTGHLADRLPAYMRPHHIHLVGELPLTANGKVDRASLLERAGRPWRPAAPAARSVTRRQREVLELAEQVLQTTGLRPADRWIACGGDSLKALRLRFEIRRRWGCEVPQATVLYGDLAAIARAVDAAGPDAGSVYPVPAVASARFGPATSEQQRLWLVQHRAPGSRAYSVNQAFRIDGPVDTAALRRALRVVVRRHAALRTGFETGPEGLRQVVGEPYDPWHDPGVTPVRDEAGARAFADGFFAEPFDLTVPRMLRACWLSGEDGGTLLLHLHHIAVDGWSMNLLLRDLSAAYADASQADRREAAPTPVDVAAWQADWFATPAYRARRDQLLAYYRDLEEPREPLPVGDEGPAPRPRLLRTSLDVVRRAQLDRLCAELGLTRFQVLLGTFAWSLYGVTGLVRPRIAAPVANRPVREFEDSVGMMANTVLLPVAVAPDEELRSQLGAMGTAVGEVLERQDVALTDVLTGWEAAGETPFDVLFVLENTDVDLLRLPGCPHRPLWWAASEAKCPLTVSVVDTADGLDVLWEYTQDALTVEAVEAMAELLRRGVDALVSTGRSTARQLVAPYRTSLPEPGRGSAPEPGFTTIAEGFARQVARTPDTPALVTADGSTVSYAVLDAHAAALAADLAARYAIPSDGEPCQVALYLDPSVEHVTALLALARLNVTAVPLDPSYPPGVLAGVLERVGPLCVLVMPGGSPAPGPLLPDDVVPHAVVLTDAVPRPARAAAASHDGRVHEGTRPLYTLFTSGSTGVPKGVQIFDRTLCDLLRWQAGPGGLTAPAVTQQFSMLSFDVSFQEIFGTLCGGGTLHLVRPEWRQDAPALLERLESAGTERVFMPYVALQLLAEYGVRLGVFPSRLREVITAGEQLVCTGAIRRWFAGLPGARLFNHYGPTETHVVSALCLDGDPHRWPERPPIGRPVAGALLRVVDALGDPVPPGCTGELLIGGTMTTRCYLDDPVLNDERFVEVPGEGLFYRSGDRAWFDRRGLLHYAGRDDQQIKLSGHRLELGSIETALLRHPAVVNAVVVHDGDRLTACLECREETPSADDLTAHLSAVLPAYVRVDRFRRMNALPRTPSGKLDRRAASRAPGEEIRRSAVARTGLTQEEEQLVAAFETVTGTRIGPDQTFFEAGASSLALMRFHLRCTTELGLRFSVTDLFEHVTIPALARHLAADGSPGTGTRHTPAAVSGGAPDADDPIAVIGMSVRLPGACDLAAFWDLVLSGGSGIRRFDAPEGIVGAHSTLDGPLEFDPGHFGISPHEARLMDPQQRHLLMACVQALAHAGLADPPASRVGLVASAGENTYFQAMLREADPRSLPDGFQLALHHEKDFLATKAAYHLGLTGPAFSVQAACSGSLVAVHLAAGMLRQGDAEVMLAAGVLVDPGLSAGYRYRPQHIFSVDGACRSFSDDATGTIGASGVGVVVLKPLRRARRDGDTVYAVITGSAVNNDGSAKMSYSAPSLAGQREVIRTALARAGRTGADLGYVEAHGTGTRLGDPIEVGALREAFGVAESGRCALTSVKSQLGHMGAAAGVVGLIRAVLSVHHGTVPPNIGFRSLNPEIGPDPTPFYVPTRATPWPDGRERVAAVSSFGIGGTNAHVIVERAAAADTAGAGGVPRCLVLSASSTDALRADAARIADYLRSRPGRYEAVLRHLQAGRPARGLRIAASCPDAGSATRWLRAVASGDIPHGTADPDAPPVPATGRTTPRLAEDWTAGRPVDWPAGPAPAPWDFPPPSFALAEYDFERAAGAATAGPSRLPAGEWLHQPHWVPLRRAVTAHAAGRDRRTAVVVVVSAAPLPPAAYTPFEAVASRVVRVHTADAFARRGHDVFEADPADPASLRQLLDALAPEGTDRGMDGVEWVHALPLSVAGPVGPGALERARHACLDTTAALVQALSGRTGSPRVWWLSYGARPVVGPVGRPELGLLAGPVEVAPQEGVLDGHWLDLPDAELSSWAGHVASVVGDADRYRPAGSGGPAPHRQLALRQGYWWRPGSTPVTARAAEPVALPGGEGVHLVLGGTGGIGRAIAAWLLEHTGGRVLLLSRKPALPVELTRWADRVDLVAADLATTPAHQVLAVVAGHTARLDGVIHAAGVGFGGLLVRRRAAAMREAAAARENGALVVEQVIQRYRPAFAVYCSSMSALLGGVGQCDYAAGAGLLDGFAQYRGDGAETTARIGINWDAWRETGMATRVPAADSRHQAHLEVGLTVREGAEVFARAVSLQLPQVFVSTTGIEASRAFYAPAVRDRAQPDPRLERPGAAHDAGGTAGTGDADGTEARARLVGRWLRESLGVEHLDPDDVLYDLGVDSLMLLDLITKVDETFGVELDLASFSHRVSLTEILKHLQGALALAEPTPGAARHAAVRSAPGAALDVWQEGTGPAVLCLVHPVGGDVQVYRTLVASLGPAPTVCLIADPALRDPTAPQWSLAERARHYDAVLRSRFGGPDSHLRLAGWSFGARVAMEMAGLAEAAGQPVDALYLLDPPPPEAGALISAYDETHLEAVFAAELGSGDQAASRAHGRAYAERLAHCCRANLRSLAGHRVRPLTSTPTLVWWAEQPSPGLPAPVDPQETARQWDACLPPASSRRWLPTGHYGIVAPPHVHTVAEAMRTALPDPVAGSRHGDH
ncbi:amino acid adenylation domain-containing protein [Streptomyces sp. NBC_01728]|uniref:non-ribosomal peptide synthetase n=1 Tax=unclassified Streptomyces TaxID=2593676 RepID=UPI00224C827E|nr:MULTISPECIES: non-ribosomal peptide synthetase [unclassified Streptomyces]MCX4461412.1 amino acid adenylation domain-containing protein [Streptomyces sp. NBC_01719]MCX4490320.1 amino acid adenylation domain-containing protein [Streptomyces sp. NBC_01728]